VQGVNTPDSILKISPLTPKDRSDLEYMLKIGVDWVALSFVQQPGDIEEIHELIDQHLPEGQFKPCVMAKIEKPSCFDGDNLERLVGLCNGIMVARVSSIWLCCLVQDATKPGSPAFIP
jgi:pyruvate kinase